MARTGSTDEHAWLVALILAIGIATAVNLITFAVLYDAIFSQGPGLSENATQVLSTAFGGFLGVLGGYIGYRAGRESAVEDTEASPVQVVPRPLEPAPGSAPVPEPTVTVTDEDDHRQAEEHDGQDDG